MAIEKISEGMSNQFLIHGFIATIVGLFCFFLSSFIAFSVFAIAIAFFIMKTGLMVDTSTKMYKNYQSTFGLTFGQWKTFADATGAILILSTEQKTIKGLMPGMMPIGRSPVIRVRTYDIIVNYGINAVQVNDFLTYKSARNAFVAITESLEIDGRDFVAEKLAENRANRISRAR